MIWLPLSYCDIKLNLPEGYSASEKLIDAVVFLSKVGDHYESKLAGRIKRKGNIQHIPVHECGANYVIHENTIYPLPRDICDFYSSLLNGLDEKNLTFPEILKLGRNDRRIIDLIYDPLIFESAQKQSLSYGTNCTLPGLNAILYKYQEQGVAWMHSSLKSINGLILADEMGLGKTIQIIALLLQIPVSEENPALIICTSTLLANWFRELEKFSPQLSKYIHRGTQRVSTYKKLKGNQVVITTYDTLLEDISLFRSVNWTIVIADEAQNIKNPSSQRRKAIVQVPRKYTIAVTGTPIENSIKDIWSLSDFVIPTILGSEAEFDSMYSDYGDSPREIASLTAPFVLRRLVSEVADDLPERIDVDIPLELGEVLSKKYDEIRKDISVRYSSSAALVATGQLQMFCAHPWLQADSYGTDNWEDLVDLKTGSTCEIYTPKIVQAIEIIKEAFSESKKVILFSLFNKIADLLIIALRNHAENDFYWATINGSTPQQDRQQLVDDFSNHVGPGILVLNPKAAGAGLNITAATIVIHYTQVWNPAIEAQASARAHRRGQKAPVYIYRLFYEKTVEEVMLERTLWKRSIANDAVPVSSRNIDDIKKALLMSPAL